MGNSFLSVAAAHDAETRVRGSRFIAFAAPVADQAKLGRRWRSGRVPTSTPRILARPGAAATEGGGQWMPASHPGVRARPSSLRPMREITGGVVDFETRGQLVFYRPEIDRTGLAHRVSTF